MPGFDRIATVYEPLERLSFSDHLQQARRFCLPHVRRCRRGLLLGDGDGRFSAALLESAPRIQLDSIDLSSRMLQLAQHRAGANRDRITPLNRDALQYAYPADTYDFIGLHFCLDCFSQKAIDTLLPQLERSLRSGGRIAYSDFQGHRYWQRTVVAALYLCFRAGAGLKTRSLPEVKWSPQVKPVADARFLRGLVFSRVLETP